MEEHGGAGASKKKLMAQAWRELNPILAQGWMGQGKSKSISTGLAESSGKGLRMAGANQCPKAGGNVGAEGCHGMPWSEVNPVAQASTEVKGQGWG